MIIGSKLQNKCRVPKETLPCFLYEILLQTPGAQCDSHTNHTQSATRTHFCYSPLCIFILDYFLIFLQIDCKKTKKCNEHTERSIVSPHKNEIINKSMNVLFSYYKSIKLEEKKGFVSVKVNGCKSCG